MFILMAVNGVDYNFEKYLLNSLLPIYQLYINKNKNIIYCILIY